MSLSVSLSAAISADITSITITDSTSYGTRSNYYVYLSANKIAYDNSSSALTVTSYDPHTVTAWTVGYDVDGAYQFLYAAFKVYDNSHTYAKYDAVYNGGSVFRSLQNSNTGQGTNNTAYWEVITNPSSLALNKGQSNESTNIDTFVYWRVFGAFSQQFYGDKISQETLIPTNDDPKLIYPYNLLSDWLRAIQTADQRTQPLSGELICRKIQSRFIDTNVVTP